MSVLGKQASEREQIVLDRLKEYVGTKESPIFHLGDAKRLCSEFYEGEIEVAFDDIRRVRLIEVAPGYQNTSPRYYQFPKYEYPKSEKPIWIITIHTTEFGGDKEKARFIREVECDGKDYSLDLLGLYKLGSEILKGYIRCARATGTEIKYYWDHILNDRAGWAHVKGDYHVDKNGDRVKNDYHVEHRGDFEVRLQEKKILRANY